MIADLQQQLGIDASFFTQLVIFFVVFNALRYIYFAPYGKLIAKRESQSDGLTDKAAALVSEAEALENQYKQALSDAKKAALEDKDKNLSGVKAECDKVLNAAKDSSKKKIESARAASAKTYKDDLSSVLPQAETMAKTLMDKLVHAKVRL